MVHQLSVLMSYLCKLLRLVLRELFFELNHLHLALADTPRFGLTQQEVAIAVGDNLLFL